MLVVQGAQGVAIVELTGFDKQGAGYRWRARSATGLRGRGTGVLAERYESTPGRGDTVHLVDSGSDLMIAAGGFVLAWSYADPDAGWLYVDGAATTRTAPATEFETFALRRP